MVLVQMITRSASLNSGGTSPADTCDVFALLHRKMENRHSNIAKSLIFCRVCIIIYRQSCHVMAQSHPGLALRNRALNQSTTQQEKTLLSLYCDIHIS